MRFLFDCFGKLEKQILPLIVGSLLFAFSSGSAAFAIEDQDCLECHQDLKLKQILATGELRLLYVDLEKWERDVHHKRGIKCTDCHEETTPFSHPKEGIRKVACEQCHPENCEENQLNLHSEFVGITNKPLPECYDCHTKHSVRTKDDPDSTINRENIGKTCCSCHQEITPNRLAAFLPTSLLLGHRKCDVNEKFDLKICINCHGDAGHGPLTAYPEYCITCHNTSKMAGFLSATHSGVSFREQPLRFMMERVSLLLNLTLISVAFITLLIYLARVFKVRRKKKE